MISQEVQPQDIFPKLHSIAPALVSCLLLEVLALHRRGTVTLLNDPPLFSGWCFFTESFDVER